MQVCNICGKRIQDKDDHPNAVTVHIACALEASNPPGLSDNVMYRVHCETRRLQVLSREVPHPVVDNRYFPSCYND